MRIYVEPNALDTARMECERLVNELASIQDSFSNITRSLDLGIKAKENVQKYIDNLNNEVSNAQRAVNSHAVFLNRAMESYFEAENYSKRETDRLKNDLLGSYKGGAGSSSSLNPVPPRPYPGPGPGVGPIPEPIRPLPGINTSTGISNLAASQMANTLLSNVKNQLLKYKNTPNLKSISCSTTISSRGISFGDRGYRNAISGLVYSSYSKMVNIVRAAIPDLIRSVLGYYPNWKVAVVSYGGGLSQRSSSYSSSWSLRYSLSFSIYF